jgi:hypothetical protein
MWEVVGRPLVAAFNYAFSDPRRRLSDRQRMGLITLIYKGGGKPRADPASYRPITLLNTDLKIIAKVMVLRLGPAMESIIDSTQTAFVPGRDIADNVLLHLEEIDYVQEQPGQQGCILFLDFEKAYDRLDRDWLFFFWSECVTRDGVTQQTTTPQKVRQEGRRNLANVALRGAAARAPTARS